MIPTGLRQINEFHDFGCVRSIPTDKCAMIYDLTWLFLLEWLCETKFDDMKRYEVMVAVLIAIKLVHRTHENLSYWPRGFREFSANTFLSNSFAFIYYLILIFVFACFTDKYFVMNCNNDC